MASELDARPFKQLLRLIVRAFYPAQCPPAHHQDGTEEGSRSKLAKIDTTGLGVVLLDYLLEREWVGEEQICTDLGQHHKILRRALKFLENEHLLMSHSQRETKRSQKKDIVKNAVESRTQQLQQLQEVQAKDQDEDDEEQVQKQHTYSYWAVDFPRAFDMLQLRLHVMRRLLKDELEAKEVLAKYVCKAAHCNKEYNSFDMMDIIRMDGSMVCAMCDGVVEQVLATGQTGDEEQRKARRERLTKLFKDMEKQLEPINRLVNALKQTQPPHHGTIQEWARLQQARVLAGAAGAAMANGSHGDGRSEANRHRSQGVTQLTEAGGAARNALYQETHVQVALVGEPTSRAAAPGAAAAAAGPGMPTLGVSAASQGAPSMQPFFLSRGSAAQLQQPAVQAKSPSIKNGPAGNDEYTQKMLAAMGGAAANSPLSDGPAAKRMKTDVVKHEHQLSVKAEDMAPTSTATPAAAEDEDWEDI